MSLSPESNQESGSTAPAKRDSSEVLAEKYAPFDHNSTVFGPFEDEGKRDAEFFGKLSDMLLELMLDFHAWSTARPVQEADRTAILLEEEIKSVIEMEQEQEKTRQRLNDFVTRIKLALAALTGLAA